MADTPAREAVLAALQDADHSVTDALSLLDAAITEALHEYADYLKAMDHQCVALVGPYWYGEGWRQAADHLHDLADGHAYRKESGTPLPLLRKVSRDAAEAPEPDGQEAHDS